MGGIMMSYSACMYGGLCTGCMRCQDDGYELDNFEQEDDFYAVVREVLEYYNNSPYALFLSLVRNVEMFKDIRKDFYNAVKNGHVEDNAIVLAWDDETITYDRDYVEEWDASDFDSYLCFWEEKEFAVMTEIMHNEEKAVLLRKHETKPLHTNGLDKWMNTSLLVTHTPLRAPASNA